MKNINNKIHNRLNKLNEKINSEALGEDKKMKDSAYYYLFYFENELEDVFRPIDISTWEKVFHEEIKSITPLKKQ